jgi:signal transduction histidine kinase
MARSGSLPGRRTAVPIKVAIAATAALIAWGEARRHRALSQQRRANAAEVTALRDELASHEAAATRLAHDLVPTAVRRVQQGAFEHEALAGLVSDAEQGAKWEPAHQAVLTALVHAVETQEGLRDSAQRALVNLAHRVQATVHKQAVELRAMQEKHGDHPGFSEDLALVDHYNALTGRLFDSIAVLSGAPPIRQWRKNVALINVLRGAMSRIKDYQRVDLGAVADLAVTGSAVEPLIHALAELLDNATHYSPPGSRVSLTASEVQSGVAITVEDTGLGLTEEARARAEAVLAHAGAELDLNDLGETPRLGLAVVGRLSRENGFTVRLQSRVPSDDAGSDSGPGVRAILTVPRELITESPVPGGEIARAATLPPSKPRSGREAKESTQNAKPELSYTPEGLPRRTRRSSSAAPRTSRRNNSPQAPAGPGAAPGAWLDDFRGETPDSGDQGSEVSTEKES